MEELLFYLHYSMFLFKPFMKKVSLGHKINLHYSMFLFKPKRNDSKMGRNNIYITVCFYLNYKTYTRPTPIPSFTLQYVSI